MPNITKTLILLSSLLAFTLVTASGVAFHGTHLSPNDVAAILLHACSLLFCLHYLIGHEEQSVTLDLSRPESLFCLFYLAYYVLLNWLAIVFDQPGHRHSLEIAALTLTGLACFRLGLHLSGYKRGVKPSFRLSPERADFLLKLAKVAMILLVGYWAWKIQNGTFFSHVGYIPQKKTVFASIMQNVIGPIQVPLFLLFGPILVSLPHEKAKGARRLLVFYMLATAACFTLSSNTLTMIDAALFTAASLNLAQKEPVRIKTYVVAAAVCVFLFGLILSIRAVATAYGNFGHSGNQLTDVVSAVGKKSNNSASLENATFDRAFNQVNLLSEIMDKLDDGFPYLHGSAIWTLLYSLVPRAIWPAKPMVTPMQLMIRGAYDLPLRDDATGPLLESYVNGGWILVVLSFIAIGWFAGWATKRAAYKTSIASVLILCYWWQVIGLMEQELLLTFAAAVRTVAVIGFFFWMYKKAQRTYRYFIAEMPPVTVGPSAAAVIRREKA